MYKRININLDTEQIARIKKLPRMKYFNLSGFLRELMDKFEREMKNKKVKEL